MFSYPNLIPLPAEDVQRIRDTIAPYRFERLYGAWFERNVIREAHDAVVRSADRSIQALRAVDR
jgi:hypothetical protein